MPFFFFFLSFFLSFLDFLPFLSFFLSFLDFFLDDFLLASSASFSSDATVDVGARAPEIGLSDLDEEGVWVWTDGSSSSYLHWGGPLEGSGSGEDCAIFGWGDGGLWFDVPCGSGRDGYICSTR